MQLRKRKSDDHDQRPFVKKKKTKKSVEIDSEFEDQLEGDRVKRLNYLIEQTEIFSHFVQDGQRHRIDQEINDDRQSFRFDQSPWYIENGQMRDYQIRGLNWLISLYEHGINGILADEMGLGKTLQAISFLGYLKLVRHETSPHLIIAPKSTLQNWMNELKRWVPALTARCLIGYEDERRRIINEELQAGGWDVLVTSYEVVLREISYLKKIRWSYVIIDEAHRIKNDQSKLSRYVRLFQSTHRLLITGTPLQNNLHELWALFNFLLPDIFNSANDLNSWFDTEKLLNNDQNLVERFHQILQPFLLRRLKSEVEKKLPPKIETKLYVGLTPFQRDWYKKVLMKDLELLNNSTGKFSRVRLMNMLVQLRKCADHPYLFPGAEPGPPYTTDRHLVDHCGKMRILDKLLLKLKEQNSRVLIFSQMTRMLDIIEDYCLWKEFDYCRLDGDTSHEDRQASIDLFNAPNSSKFVFLLSTRAGGLGINLASADVVILYDTDWNPQVDLQAMDRVHRIGQTKTVRVFRLITEKSIEERIVERAEMKLHLDHLIIQQGRLRDQTIRLTNEELLATIRHGISHVFTSTSDEEDLDIELILTQGEQKTKELREKFVKLNEHQLRQMTIENKHQQQSIYQFEGEDYREKHTDLIDPKWIELPKRKRPTYYNLDSSIEVIHHDFQFYSRGQTNEFSQWKKTHFDQFIRANVKYGRDDLQSISLSIPDKTPDEVKRYAHVFWQRYKELKNSDRLIKQIEEGELKLQQQRAIDRKLAQYKAPFHQLTVPVTSHRKRTFTEEEDRFLLCSFHKFHFDSEAIRPSLLQSSQFRFDWFLKSRRDQDLKKRLAMLTKKIVFIDK